MKHFLFLTTTNLAADPRLTKELKLALNQGHKTTVILFFLGNWSDAKSGDLARELEHTYPGKVNILVLDATSKNRLSWFFWGLLEKFGRRIYPFFKKNVFINVLANTRRSVQLLRKSKSLIVRPDLILAHNMGTLYPAYCLAKRHKIPFIFDMEDYHPGELAHKDKDNERGRREFLLRKLLPKAKAITSASPLIEKYTLELIGGHSQHSIILNSFPESEFIPPIIQKFRQEEPLRLIWFGQKIGPGRGLEQLFQGLSNISKSDIVPIHLEIIGDWEIKFKNHTFLPFHEAIKDASVSVVAQDPLPQAELHAQLNYYDIGLALEPGKDLNNNLALSNKIIAYAQTGLYILATSTEAQSQFIKDSPDRGVICGQSSSEIHQALEKIIKNREAIINGKENRYKNGRKLGWEQATTKLVNLWNDAIEK